MTAGRHAGGAKGRVQRQNTVKAGLPRVILSVLTTAELERLLFEDVPYGDLTTEALRIAAAGCRVTFVARSAMTVAAIEEAAAHLALVGATAHPRRLRASRLRPARFRWNARAWPPRCGGPGRFRRR
jgi:Quinolinate phosphoribosyl transferase, N-terminal domain